MLLNLISHSKKVAASWAELHLNFISRRSGNLPQIMLILVLMIRPKSDTNFHVFSQAILYSYVSTIVESVWEMGRCILCVCLVWRKYNEGLHGFASHGIRKHNYVCMYVYSRGGPQPAPAPRPSLIYCACKHNYVCMYIVGEGLNRPQHRDHPWSIVLVNITKYVCI
jgi:hypothetical protein